MTAQLSSPLRIAMWSGPRNISTAMMRAWENRADTFVTDEPFYAHYLANSNDKHPGHEDILASQPNDWEEVVQQCLASEQPGCTIHYQKHMTHHVLPHISLEWLASLKNIFLIRSPEAVVASYSKSRPELNVMDVGFIQQTRLFNKVTELTSSPPLVINSYKLLQNPLSAMQLICNHCEIAFDDAMLNWPAGKRTSDGIWAPYWYKSVEASTGFSAPREQSTIQLDKKQQQIVDQCLPHYETMAVHSVNF